MFGASEEGLVLNHCTVGVWGMGARMRLSGRFGGLKAEQRAGVLPVTRTHPITNFL